MLSPDNVIIGEREIPGGTPVFRGTPVPYRALLDSLEGCRTLDEFPDDFPTVSRQAAVHAVEPAKAFLVSELE